MKTEGPRPTAPGDQWHQENQRNPKNDRKTKDNLTGGSSASRGPAKPKNRSKNKGQPLYTPQNPCKKHQGSSIISQNNFSFDFAKQNQTPSPKGTSKAPPRPGPLMTIKTQRHDPGSRTQEPLRFPGLSKPPTSDTA